MRHNATTSAMRLLRMWACVIRRGNLVRSGMEKTSYARRPHDAGVLVASPFGGIRLARVLWVLSLVVVASALLFGFLTPDFLLPVERPMTALIVASCLLSLAGSSVGALMASRRPHNPVGWIFLSMGVLYGVRRLVEAYADYALLARPGLPLGEVAAWASTWLRLSPLIALGTILVLLFPDGRLPSARWRTVAFATCGGAILVALGDAFRSGPLPTYYYVDNPFGIGGAFPADSFAEASTIVGGVLLSASCFASILALALRLRHAQGPERRRLAWFAGAAFPALLVSAAALLNWSIERFGLLVLGETFSPLLRVAEVSVLLVRVDETAGTMVALPGRQPRALECLRHPDDADLRLRGYQQAWPLRHEWHGTTGYVALVAGVRRRHLRRSLAARFRIPGGLSLRHLLSSRGGRRTATGTARAGRGLRGRLGRAGVLPRGHVPGGLPGSLEDRGDFRRS